MQETSSQYSVGILVGKNQYQKYKYQYIIKLRFNVETVSDSCAAGKASDSSGTNLQNLIQADK